MKTIPLILLLTFLIVNLYANKNWIEIEPINITIIVKSNTRLDINLSKIEPINKMMKKATIIKELIDATNKKAKPSSNEKKWFVVNKEDNK